MSLSLELETEGFRAWTEELIKGMSKDGRKKILRGLAFEFLRQVILATPVDEGRARGGWASYLIAQGLPVQSAGPTWRQGLAEGTFRESFGGKEGSILLVNAVPYIVVLEFGHSRQAPHGMVRLTFRRMRARGAAKQAVFAQLQKTVEQANRTFKARARRRLPA